MPFKSDKQRRWMFKNEPEIAERWAHEGKEKDKKDKDDKKKKRKTLKGIG